LRSRGWIRYCRGHYRNKSWKITRTNNVDCLNWKSIVLSSRQTCSIIIGCICINDSQYLCNRTSASLIPPNLISSHYWTAVICFSPLDIYWCLRIRSDYLLQIYWGKWNDRCPNIDNIWLRTYSHNICCNNIDSIAKACCYRNYYLAECCWIHSLV
jgi:hypothetical protein